MRKLGTVAWLTGLWALLWRDLDPATLAVGVVVCGAVVAAFDRGRAPIREHRLRPLGIAAFLAHFSYKLVEANLVLAREVVTPTNSIETGIVGVPMPDCSDLVVTVVANAVSLTPGTVTVEVTRGTPAVVYVHVLHLHDIDRAREDVRTMMRLARRAIEPVTDVRAQEEMS